jgi:hypothetical protein
MEQVEEQAPEWLYDPHREANEKQRLRESLRVQRRREASDALNLRVEAARAEREARAEQDKADFAAMVERSNLAHEVAVADLRAIPDEVEKTGKIRADVIRQAQQRWLLHLIPYDQLIYVRDQDAFYPVPSRPEYQAVVAENQRLWREHSEAEAAIHERYAEELTALKVRTLDAQTEALKPLSQTEAMLVLHGRLEEIPASQKEQCRAAFTADIQAQGHAKT